MIIVLLILIVIVVFITVACSQKQEYPLSTCLVACNDNTKYSDFWPVVQYSWKSKCDIKAILIYVSDKDPLPGPDVIHFKPVPGIPTSFQSQCIRLLYPALLKVKGSVIISDIDLVPMSKSYYVNHNATRNQFVVYRSNVLQGQIPMCFNAATPQVWSEVFKITSIDDIRNTLVKWYKESTNKWFCDQVMLYRTVTNYPNVKWLTDKSQGFRRLDREDLSQTGNFSDFHMPRPYSKYAELIQTLI